MLAFDMVDDDIEYAKTTQSTPTKYNKTLNNNNYNNNNNINSVYYKQYGYDVPTLGSENAFNLVHSNDFPTRFGVNDETFETQLEQLPAIQTLIRKSHSYSGTIKPKGTILKQDSLNGRIATSLTADNLLENLKKIDSVTYFLDPHACSNGNTNNNGMINDNQIVFIEDDMADGSVVPIPVDTDDQEDTLLLPDAINAASPSRRNCSRRYSRSSSSSSVSARSSMCYRVHTYITRNWYLNYLVPLSILLLLMLVAYLTRDYAKRLLFWIETQNPWIIFAIFMLLFVIVSFPVVVGYFVLLITSGYLFGVFKGLLTVILGANVGIALAHVIIRALRHRIPLHRLIKNETGRAILRVIAGPRAFRVVLFTRLTPIPFGLQNAIFGVSSINPRTYHTATFIGLLPAQIINVYLGSTLRSMHEVLNSHGTAVTGYISFGIEVICGVALMFWVVQKARKELAETLLTCGTERKIIDIQV